MVAVIVYQSVMLLAYRYAGSESTTMMWVILIILTLFLILIGYYLVAPFLAWFRSPGNDGSSTRTLIVHMSREDCIKLDGLTADHVIDSITVRSQTTDETTTMQVKRTN